MLGVSVCTVSYITVLYCMLISASGSLTRMVMFWTKLSKVVYIQYSK